MGKRGLKPLLSSKNTEQPVTMMRLLNYLDGEHDLLEVCDQIGRSVNECIPIIKKLLDEKLLVKEHGGYMSASR
jgi:aminopeptidase-like protein